MSSQPPGLSQVGEELVAPAGAREVGAWLAAFSRTCKTCRLYDANSPAVVRFREELYAGLHALHERFDDITLEVAGRELSFAGVVVYSASSRDDNLAAILHRDGIRRISFQKQIGAAELDAFVDLILRVTGQSGGEEDLVTLLWEHELPGISVVAAPLEGDTDGGGEEGVDDTPPMPWPRPEPSSASAAGVAGGGERGGDESRSDDFNLLARFASLDTAFDELESTAIQEIARLQQAYESETARPVVVRALETVASCLAADPTPNDRRELASFLPRVLREAIVTGYWVAARGALGMVRACDPEWSEAVFFESLTAGPSLSLTRRAVAALDAQGQAGVDAFLALATESGRNALDWLMLVLAESQEQRTRRSLARAIAAIVSDCPERLLPWMGDERWYVVRNVVHILGWIGGDRVAVHLQAAIHHPEVRVRREVVAALGAVTPDTARPILMSMLMSAGDRLFTTILHQLSTASHPVVAQRLVEMLRDDQFPDRSDDEKRAVYMALARQGEGVLPALEEELTRGGLFARGLDDHIQAVARSVARIGTPAARQALERGARASRAGTRKACEMALASLGTNHDE